VETSFYTVEEAAKVLQLTTPGRIRLTLRDGLMTDPAGGA
jgi:hypothetical protein